MVLELMRAFSSPALRAFVVWAPMLEEDDEPAAGLAAARDADPRIRSWWDPDHLAGQALARTLGLPHPAWDVYLLYTRDAPWPPGDPPAPDLYMHQLGRPAPPELLLRPNRLLEETARLLRSSGRGGGPPPGRAGADPPPRQAGP